MSESIIVTSARTEDLNAATRASIIDVCIAAHQKDDFKHIFVYIPAGGIHALAYRAQELVSHAVVTTRWLQPEGLPFYARPTWMRSRPYRRIKARVSAARLCVILRHFCLILRLPV